MREIDRMREDMLSRGYVAMETPVSKEGGGRITEILNAWNLRYEGLFKLAQHSLTKEDITNPRIVWFDAVKGGERLCWYFHPDYASYAALFKLSFK